MGDPYILVSGTELQVVTVYCPHCGIGFTVDLTQPFPANMDHGVTEGCCARPAGADGPGIPC